MTVRCWICTVNVDNWVTLAISKVPPVRIAGTAISTATTPVGGPPASATALLAADVGASTAILGLAHSVGNPILAAAVERVGVLAVGYRLPVLRWVGDELVRAVVLACLALPACCTAASVGRSAA